MRQNHGSPLATSVEGHGPAARTVVVIEDDADIRTLIETILVRAGMTVHTASTAGEGIALASRLVPDLVTIDIGLPDADGLDVAAFIRDLTATRDVPILMVSASAQASDMERARARGVEAFLSKPFRPRELRAKVAALCAAADAPLPEAPRSIVSLIRQERFTAAAAS